MGSPVLAAREARWTKRLALAADLGPDGSLLTLTLRMPAPLRAGGAYDERARLLFEDLADRVVASGLSPTAREFRVGADGPEGYLSLAAHARAAKELAVAFEEGHPWGALADVDVMSSSGAALGRGDLGLAPRECLVCGAEAAVCVAGKRHGTEELRAKIEDIFARRRDAIGTSPRGRNTP